MTFRELAALRDAWQEGRDYQLALMAGIQATLHNKWYEKPGGGKFTPADFMPSKYAQQSPAQTLAERIENQRIAIVAALEMAAAANGVN
jgi:hypothetical protein